MLKNCVPWFIAIVVSTKTCVSSSEFPVNSLQSYLPSLDSSLITKPIQTLYQAPQSAINLLHRVNPLSYLMSSSDSPSNSTLPPSQKFNYVMKSPYLRKTNKYVAAAAAGATTTIPQIIYNQHTTTPYDKLKELLHPSQYYPAEKPLASSSFIQTQKVRNQSFVELLPMVNNNTGAGQTIKILLPTDVVVKETPNVLVQNIGTDFDLFKQVLEHLERSFYRVTFNKLLSISPPGRQENGISFAQSGLFLYLQLMALCTELDGKSVTQIKQSLGLQTTCSEQIQRLKQVISSLPKTSDFFKFRWSSRLVLGARVKISGEFQDNVGLPLHVHLNQLNRDIDPEELTQRLNHMVVSDSGGSMHDTFEEDELLNGVCAAWLTTVYLRARWRSAPTVLNGSRLFYDGSAPPRTVRMIRINDIMRYAHLTDWDAEAMEIQYATSELTILLLVPRGRSLNNLAEKISTENLSYVYDKMLTKRVAVSLPIYTLRMTLLVPGKLEMMGISRLVDTKAGASCESLKLSHGVQRIMFWAEAGRNAFKDDASADGSDTNSETWWRVYAEPTFFEWTGITSTDLITHHLFNVRIGVANCLGIEWDEAPELERIVDKPYIYFVRWRNITLINGNFVL